MSEDLPVFFTSDQDLVYVELIGDALVSGVYQFNDGLAPLGVIKLTTPLFFESHAMAPVWFQPIHSGESLEFTKKDRRIGGLRRSWMKASHRVAMSIPLHPDRMSIKDWTFLPGVGETLAERIENDRQINGDYGHLNALLRVKGIGKARIDSWRDFFYGG